MKKFLMVCLVSFASTGVAMADASLSQQGSRDLSGAVGEFVGTGAAFVGVSAAVPMMASGAVGESVLSASVTQIATNGDHKRLPLAKEVIVPTPDQALADRAKEN